MSARTVLIVVIAIVAGFSSAGVRAADDSESPSAARKLRVGVYDSRSVALAYGRSKRFNTAVDELMAQAKQAEKDGDKGRLEVLKKKGNALQNLRHMQVFGNAPIHDMLAQMHPAIQEQARAENLDLIVRDIDIAFQSESVEIVDITKGLVDSCQPTKDTLNIIEQMKHHAPLPLEQFPIEHEHDEKSQQSAVTSNPAAEAAAVAAAKEWLELIDAGRYEESWEHSSVHFRTVVPRERWLGEMGGLRTPLGKLISREVVSHDYRTDLPDAPIGEYVVIQFKTEYEKDKEVLETVTPVREEDGTWKVDGYYIR